jgi:imidazolonepropionase-like amidohydrolase
LVQAGIDCIEHACGLTEETLPLFQERGVAIVPTMVNIESFPAIANQAQPRFPRYAAHMRLLHQRRYATIGAAIEAGLPVYAGTDAGGSLPHGLVAGEVAELQACGLSPIQALDAACWSARSWLRRPALGEGQPADLVVYQADPREDTAVLAAPHAVVLRGQIR